MPNSFDTIHQLWVFTIKPKTTLINPDLEAYLNIVVCENKRAKIGHEN
jgi:hypothetical protein